MSKQEVLVTNLATIPAHSATKEKTMMILDYYS